jgi:hypothetical protein
MKKSAKKLQLNAESLYRLDPLPKVAGGGALTPACSVVNTCPITGCTCENPTAKSCRNC